jgi:transcriptional regulator with XRE-family HTH domain
MARKKRKAPSTPGEWLKEARGERKQWEMAEALKVSQPTINDWENDRKSPRPHRLPAIAAAYGVDVVKLIPKSKPTARVAA